MLTMMSRRVCSLGIALLVLSLFLNVLLTKRFEFSNRRTPMASGSGLSSVGSALDTMDAATYGSPSWLSKCKRIYMDVGSNIGVQVRKFYEPEKYGDAPIIKLFDQQFGNAQERRRPGVENELCVLGMEPSPQLRPRLQKLEEAYQKRGWMVHIYPFAAFVEEKEMEFEMRDGVGSGTASSLNSTLLNLPKDYGKTTWQSSCASH